MAEEHGEKPKNLEELAKHIEHAKHQDFTGRMSAFELLYKEEHKYIPLIREHVQGMVFRNPATGLEGAYDVGYKKLDNLVKGPHTEKVGEENLASVMEAYMSHFLKLVLKGDALAEHEKLVKNMEHSPRERRQMIGALFSQYVKDEEGHPINPLDEQWLKANADKAKIDIINYLRDTLGKRTVDSYTGFYHQNLSRELIKHDEQPLVVKHLRDKYKEAKIEHPDEHFHATKDTQSLLTIHRYALQGDSQALSRLGYKTPLQRAEGGQGGQAPAGGGG